MEMRKHTPIPDPEGNTALGICRRSSGGNQGPIQVLWGLKLIQFWGPLYGKEHKITNKKLGTKMNIYFGPLSGRWKGFVQVRGPAA